MFEKVNPAHPDKVADRIAGALVDLAYQKEENPRIAVEVLIGHSECSIIAETSVHLGEGDVQSVVERIAGHVRTDYKEVPQDEHLARNQEHGLRCGDNGIFRGTPVTEEQKRLTNIAQELYQQYESDGKYILSGKRLMYPDAEVNPLGEWIGGTGVDSGAVNRKLGSDMGDSVTGGGLHGKDLSKADVSVNIYAWLQAQAQGQTVEYTCAIGDSMIAGIPYEGIVDTARRYIKEIGGFEKFAEWGLIR